MIDLFTRVGARLTAGFLFEYQAVELVVKNNLKKYQMIFVFLVGLILPLGIENAERHHKLKLKIMKITKKIVEIIGTVDLPFSAISFLMNKKWFMCNGGQQSLLKRGKNTQSYRTIIDK